MARLTKAQVIEVAASMLAELGRVPEEVWEGTWPMFETIIGDEVVVVGVREREVEA